METHFVQTALYYDECEVGKHTPSLLEKLQCLQDYLDDSFYLDRCDMVTHFGEMGLLSTVGLEEY